MYSRNPLSRMTNLSLRIKCSEHPKCFENLQIHDPPHRYELMKKISACYLTIRLKHIGKVKNEEQIAQKVRQKFNKLTLFLNQ